MTRTVRRHKTWLVTVCVLAAMMISLYGWQQLHAQGPLAPRGPLSPHGPLSATPKASAPAAPTVAAATAPTIEMGAVQPTGVKAMNIKNWDGSVTSILRFKYKTIDNKVVTVHLPATYKKEKMSREAWDTLFQCFGMDVEAVMEAKSRGRMQEWGDMLGQAIAQAQTAEGDVSQGGNPASQAFDFAKMHGTSGDGSVMMPPMLPGMF